MSNLLETRSITIEDFASYRTANRGDLQAQFLPLFRDFSLEGGGTVSQDVQSAGRIGLQSIAPPNRCDRGGDGLCKAALYKYRIAVEVYTAALEIFTVTSVPILDDYGTGLTCTGFTYAQVRFAAPYTVANPIGMACDIVGKVQALVFSHGG